MTCGGLATPREVSVMVQISVADAIFFDFLDEYGLSGDIVFTASASTNYVGG
jgi:hypothetical protein